MSRVKFGDVVKDVKINIDRLNNPYEYYVAGDHMDSEDLTIHRKGCFTTDDVGPAFIRVFKPGQILYGSRRTYLKKIAVADFEGVCANTTFVFETKDPHAFEQRLLPFIMLSKDFTTWSIAKSKGSTNPYVLFSDLADFEFELPPLEEQKVLVDKLWAAYRLKEAYKKLLVATDEMVKSQFIEMFGTVENNTHNFPIMTIGEFANCFAGATPSTSHPEYWENGRIRWMSSGEVHKGHVEDTDFRITELGYKSASTRMVPIHSIVIAIAGQGKTRGTVAITEVDLCTNQSLCAIVPDERVNYLYLYHNLQGRYLELRGLSGDVNGRGGLNLKIIQKIPVILPPIEKQQQFASIAQQADKSKFGDFKSQFIEMFGNPLSLNQKNELKRLGECCILNPRRPNIALCDTDKVSFIPMPAVSEDGYLVDMTDEEYGKVKKGFTYFENNDVLFAKITPCMENGKGAIVHGLTNGIGMGSTEFHVLRPINGISSPYWLLALTRMPIFRERAAKNMSGTGGQKRVSASYLDHFMVGLPAIEEQRRFEAIYKQADKSKSVIQKALVYLNDIQSDELGKIA